ncbi:histidinol-phosphate transaminase [bacterium]|nr:MAG: histidinol-phosphate transaminase [bacterium]
MHPFDQLVRAAMREVPPYVPGTPVEEVRRRFGLERVIKLASNENPLGTSPRALEALRSIERLNVYPDDVNLELRRRLGERCGVGPESIVLGHGSNELLRYLFTLIVEPGDDLICAKETFSLYRHDARMLGANAVEVPLRDGVHDLNAMLTALTPRTKIVILCDPNNPTGTRVSREAYRRFLNELPPEVLLVVDQAYVEFADEDAIDATLDLGVRPNMLVLRTLSKLYGLAAVRLGYAVGDPAICTWLTRAHVPFNVTLPSVRAALAALEDHEFMERTRANNERGKAYLYGQIERLGLWAYRSAANFICLHLPVAADRAYLDLVRRGVIVRAGTSFHLPQHIRVTVGTPEENELFVEALEQALESWTAASPA